MSQNAIKGSVNIRSDYAEKISDKIISDFKKYLNIDSCTLGSTGKKKYMDYSGDIDIAILQEFNKTNINKIKEYICKQYGDDTLFYIAHGFKILSFGYKYKEQDLFAEYKIAQVDLMFTDNLEFSSFIFHSPNYKNNESEFKGLYRTNLLAICASYIPVDTDEYETEYEYNYNEVDLDEYDIIVNNRITKFWKYSLSYTDGLRLVHKNCVGKTKYLATPQTIKEDTVLISKEPNEIVKFILGDKATLSDVNSFETLIKFILSDDYIYKDNIDVKNNILTEFFNDKRHQSKIKDIYEYIVNNVFKKNKNKELYNNTLKTGILNTINNF